jgi:hypothetical protein
LPLSVVAEVRTVFTLAVSLVTSGQTITFAELGVWLNGAGFTTDSTNVRTSAGSR